jgi:hypothetical protein
MLVAPCRRCRLTARLRNVAITCWPRGPGTMGYCTGFPSLSRLLAEVGNGRTRLAECRPGLIPVERSRLPRGTRERDIGADTGCVTDPAYSDVFTMLV